MSILVEGTLLSPAGDIIGNADIVLTSISTNLVVLSGTPMSAQTDPDGRYSFTLNNGNFAVAVSKGGNNWFSGMVTVTDVTIPKSLNALILQDAMLAEIPVDYWSYFQAQTGILFTSFSKIDEAVEITTSSKDITIVARDEAILARDSAKSDAKYVQNIADANTYHITPSDPEGTIAGLAGTPNGQSFRVGQGPGRSFKYYFNNNGAAIEISESASQASIDAINKIINYYSGDKILAAILDKMGNQTWVGVDAATGGLTEMAVRYIVSDIYERIFNAVDIHGVSVALFAGQYRTWLEASSEHPGPSDYAKQVIRDNFDSLYLNNDVSSVESLVKSSSPRPVSVTGAFSPLPTDVHYQNGEVVPVICDMTTVSGWGSSSLVASNMAYRLRTLFGQYGANYTSGGQAGELLQHTAARLGAVMFELTFPNNTIPESGSSFVIVEGMDDDLAQNTSMKAFSGTCGDVSGTLEYVRESGRFQFTRTDSGAPLLLDGATPIIPDIGPAQRIGVGILWTSKNNSYTADGSIYHDLKISTDYHSRMFEYFSSLTKRVIVMGNFLDTNWTSDRSDKYNYAMNDIMRRKYGSLFIDVQEWMTSDQAWEDTGINPTQADLDKQADGRKPPSLSRDTGHFNDIAAKAIVDKLIAPKLTELGWFRS